MTEEQLSSPPITSAFLILFATFAVVSVPLVRQFAPGGSIYTTIVTPLMLVIASGYFGYQLYSKHHFIYLGVSLVIAAALGGFFLHAYF